MGEKQEKGTIIKWVLPSLILLIVLAVLLINFSVSGRSKAVESINVKLMGLTEEYATQINHEVEKMAHMGTLAAQILSYGDKRTFDESMHIAKALMEHSEANMVIISDITGKGITYKGEKIELRKELYYAGAECGKQQYSYTDGEILGLGPSIIAINPIMQSGKTTGIIYMYYKVERIKKMFDNFSLFNQSVMTLSLDDGTIVTKAGRSTEFIEKAENIFTFLEENAESFHIEDTRNQQEALQTGSILAGTDKIARRMMYVPLHINKWYVTIGINESYVNKRISEEWQDTRGVIIAIIIILSAFVVAVLSISIVMKMKYSQHSKTLETKADMDLLTELYNKIATEREIKEYLSCKANAKAIMFVLDIDNFKKINDTRGHAFGDEVLKAIGVRLQTAFRVSDIVGRTGGDEFTIFLKDISEASIIEKEMRKLTNVFKDFNTGEYVKYSVTASIGCAIYPQDANSFDGLYKAADSALYLAKKRGKNQIARYEKESK